jgi:hypothetical protein
MSTPVGRVLATLCWSVFFSEGASREAPLICASRHYLPTNRAFEGHQENESVIRMEALRVASGCENGAKVIFGTESPF